MEEELKIFMNHPAINKSWLAEKLYGSRDARSLFSRKKTGSLKWNQMELNEMERIKRDLIRELL